VFFIMADVTLFGVEPKFGQFFRRFQF
jgi:hypothetical protein